MKGVSSKKILGIFLITFMFVTIPAFAMATDVSSTIPAPHRIGFFENFMDHVRLTFTFNKERKVDLLLHMADKQLANGEVLGGNNSIAYNKTQENYDKLMARANKIFLKMQDKGNNTNASINYMKNIVRLQNMFERHRDHADEIYTRTIERLKARNVSTERIERFEKFYNRSLSRSAGIEKRVIQRRERAMRRYQRMTNMTNATMDELLAKIDREENLTEARKIRMEKFKERTQQLRKRGIIRAEKEREMFEDFRMGRRIMRGNFSNESFQRGMNRYNQFRNNSHEGFERMKEREDYIRNRTSEMRKRIEYRREHMRDAGEEVKNFAQNQFENMSS